MVKTDHKDETTHLFVFTDASKRYWAAVLTLCRYDELSRSILKQQHEPVAFMSSAFMRAQEHWTTYEKKSFAVFNMFRRLN